MDGKELASFKNFSKQKLDWKIALLEVKCGEEPSLPNAPFFANKVPDYFYFYQPDDTEFNEPSKRDLLDKLENLKKERTLNKVLQFKKDLYKLVTGAKNIETLKVANKIKKTTKGAQEDDVDKKQDFEEELKDLEIEQTLFKELDKESFVERLISRMIAKSVPLKIHPHLSSYTISAEIFKSHNNEAEPSNAKLVEKVENKLMASKSISKFMKDAKKQLFDILGLTPKAEINVDGDTKGTKSGEESKKDSKSEEITSENKRSKTESKPSRKDKKDPNSSLFIGSLQQADYFDEKEDEFKDLYGVQGKNRPGQRARRMLAEKKYGKKAKHLQEPKVETNLESTNTNSANKLKNKAKHETAEEKLHPSWQAKRKQKLDLSAAPQGTKIKFDNAVTDTKVKEDEDLHPSWQAKRSQKVDLNAAPQGTKTKFDDKDIETKPDEDKNLHPSWIAKKNQKLAMAAAPTNTKIKFDD